MRLGKKAEIVLFGEDIHLSPVKVLAGNEYVISVAQGDDRCTITRITAQGGGGCEQSSLRLQDVLRTMAKMGAGYPESVDLIRKLDDREALNCAVAENTLPALVSVEDLADRGRNPEFLIQLPRTGAKTASATSPGR